MRAPDKIISQLAGQIGGDGDSMNDTEYGNGLLSGLHFGRTKLWEEARITVN